MLVESITETQEAILQLRPTHSLNSSDLHACESLNTAFGTTLSFWTPVSTTGKSVQCQEKSNLP